MRPPRVERGWLSLSGTGVARWPFLFRHIVRPMTSPAGRGGSGCPRPITTYLKYRGSPCPPRTPASVVVLVHVGGDEAEEDGDA